MQGIHNPCARNIALVCRARRQPAFFLWTAVQERCWCLGGPTTAAAPTELALFFCTKRGVVSGTQANGRHQRPPTCIVGRARRSVIGERTLCAWRDAPQPFCDCHGLLWISSQLCLLGLTRQGFGEVVGQVVLQQRGDWCWRSLAPHFVFKSFVALVFVAVGPRRGRG